MSEKTRQQSRTASTVTFDDHELRSTMEEYLSSDPKQSQSVWSFPTFAGLGLAFVGMSYIAREIIGSTLGIAVGPDFSSFIQVLPFIGAILLAVTGFGLFRRGKRKKNKEKKKVKVDNRSTTSGSKAYEESYSSSSPDKDRLDDYLYPKGRSSDSSGLFSRSDNYAFSLQKKLFRSRTDKKIGGVCGGLAKHFDVSPTLIRFIFVLATLLGYGSFILVYIAMMLVIPKEPVDFIEF